MATTGPDAALAFHDFPGTGDPAYLLPQMTREVRPFFEQLANGRLALQHCDACGRARYPVAPVCPYCGSSDLSWRALSGRGTVHSWVRYHKSYLPEFEPLMPYVVLSVQLEEGPRIFGRLAEERGEPRAGMPVQAIVERWPGDRHVHAFVPRERAAR